MTHKDRWGRADWLALGGLLLFTVFIWSRVLFSRDFTFGVEMDFVRQFYPARYFAADALAGGTFPLWNPYIFCGHPFFASYQTAMLYPFNLFMVGTYALFGASFSIHAQGAFVVFHFYLAGVFTYLLARDLRIGRTGSAVAAVTFMLCGFMVAHAGHINQHAAAAWIPLVFLLFNRSIERRRLSCSVAAGAVTGVALLAGHIQPVFYMCCLLLGFVVFVAVQRYRGDERKPGIVFGLGALAITVGVGAALAAAQLVPTYQLIGLSTRQEIPFEIARTASLPRWQVVGLIFPHFFGTGPENYVGGWLMWEMYGYAGIAGGVLAVVAFLRRRKGMVIFLWVALLVSLVLALGPEGYVFTLLYKTGLFFNRFRDPARTLVVFGFCMALLAGLGADYLVKTYSDARLGDRFLAARRVVLALAGGLLLLVLALSVFVLLRGGDRSAENNVALRSMVVPTLVVLALVVLLLLLGRVRLDAGWLAAVLVFLVAFDLVLMNVPWVMVKIDPDDVFKDRRASLYVASEPGEFRVETDAHTMYDSLDNGPIYGLEKASGDDSLVLEDFFLYRELVLPSQSPGVQVGLFYEGNIRSELLDVMNDVYFMTRSELHPKLAEGKFEHVAFLGGVNVYRNLTAMPGAWMSDCLAMEDNREVYEYLLDSRGEGIRDLAVVVFPERAGEEIPARGGEVKFADKEPHRLKLEADGASTGLLVVPEVYYPGWEVYVDGERREIHKANLMFRGVFLEEGDREIEFVFRPVVIWYGMAVSLAAVMFLLIYFAALFFFRRRAAREGDGE